MSVDLYIMKSFFKKKISYDPSGAGKMWPDDYKNINSNNEGIGQSDY